MDSPTQNRNIIIGIIANVILGFSLQLQNYAKKRIISLALNGVPPISPQRWLQFGTVALIMSECYNILSFGLLPTESLTPLGCFTFILNCVIPPFLFANETRTRVGCMISMFGVLVSILRCPSSQADPSDTPLILDFQKSMFIVAEIFTIFVCLTVKNYRKSNCVFRLKAYSILSTILGSQSIVIYLLLKITDMDPNNTYFLILVAIICFFMSMYMFNECLSYFPVWQLVPHYFVDLNIAVFINVGILLNGFQVTGFISNAIAFSGLLVITIGVFISAKPHFDLPSNFMETGVLNKIKQSALDSYQEQHNSTTREIETHIEGACRLGEGPDCACLDNQVGHKILELEFRKFMAQKMEDLNHNSSQSPFSQPNSRYRDPRALPV